MKESNNVVINYSPRLRGMLKNIDNGVSMFLLNLEGNSDYVYPIGYLDVAETDDMISFLQSDRFGNIPEEEGFWSSKKRSSVRVGRLVGRLLPMFPQKDIEDFVNAFKSEFNNNNDISFKVVEGGDIVKFYNEKSYEMGRGSLNRSCMRHDRCQEFMDIYKNNPNINLVILFNKKSRRILGRAILWKLTSPSGVILMDRIYTSDDSVVHLFKKFAEKNGWLYKSKQTFDCLTIIDSKSCVSDDFVVKTSNSGDGKEKFVKMVLKIDGDVKYFPYIDTLFYYDKVKNYLTNDVDDFKTNKNIIKLRDINGGSQENENYVYDVLNDEMIHIDDSVYCFYGDVYTHKNLAFFLNDKNEFISPRDLRYSKTEKSFINKEDSVFSKYLSDFISSKNSIKVYFDDDIWRSDFYPISLLNKEFMRDSISGKFYIKEKMKSVGKGTYIYNGKSK